jgi:hypothetical protein
MKNVTKTRKVNASWDVNASRIFNESCFTGDRSLSAQVMEQVTCPKMMMMIGCVKLY